MLNKKCRVCHGEEWVCEDHPDKVWGEGDGCCGGAGMLCECTFEGWVRKMENLFKLTYKKLGIPEREKFKS